MLLVVIEGAALAQAPDPVETPRFGFYIPQLSVTGDKNVLTALETTDDGCNPTPSQQMVTIDPSNLRLSIPADHPASTLFLRKRRNIPISICVDPPQSGVQVRLHIQHIPTSAGHAELHPRPPPHGYLAPGTSDPNTFPRYVTKSDPERTGTTRYSTFEDAFIVELDANGRGSVLYGVPELSGDDIITASFLFGRNQRQDQSLLVRIAEPNLEDLAPVAGNVIELVGANPQTDEGKRHPSNHWGTKEMNRALLRLARNYGAEYEHDVQFGSSNLPRDASRLPVNDMSLISGGVFDIKGNWNHYPVLLEGHTGHRAGVEADVGGGKQGHGLEPGEYPRFDRILRDQGVFALLHESTHWHIVLKNGGKVMIRHLPAQPTRIDAATMQVLIPLENQGGIPADRANVTSLSASNGVTIVSPVVSPASPFEFGPAEIRSAKNLLVTAAVPPEVSRFYIFISGFAMSSEVQGPFPIPPGEGPNGERLEDFLTVPVNVPSADASAAEKTVARLPAVTNAGWTLTLLDADQPITTDSDMVYHGVITNDTGAPISLSEVDVYYTMSTANKAFTYNLADKFLNAQGIPEDGYTGPLFRVRWTRTPSVGARGEILFTLLPEVGSGLPPLEARAKLAYKPQTLSGTVQDGMLTLTWSLEATGMQLQSSQIIDEPEWLDVTGDVVQANGVNSFTIPAPTKRTYFRLVSREEGLAVGESAIFAAGPSALLNISTRMQVLTGDNVLIAGFIITGSSPKEVIVRAIGPSLSKVGVPSALADPVLELHDASGTLVARNDNWQTTQLSGLITADQVADIQASTVAPADPKESAIIATLAPGAYTAIIRGVGDRTGVGLAEVFDLSPTTDSTLANISSRGLVQSGDNVMIGGFITGGAGATKVIVRAIGPSLPLPSALANPTLELHDANGTAFATNDDWRSNQEAAIIATTVPPTKDAESAIVATLNPGNYTAIVRGKNGTTGVALVEVYNLQ